MGLCGQSHVVLVVVVFTLVIIVCSGGIEITLNKIKREITYIKANQYGFKTAIIIDGKEYLENEIYADGEYTVYPESLEDQLQQLVPCIDIELIEELVENAKNAVTPNDTKNVQDAWDAFVRIQEDKK